MQAVTGLAQSEITPVETTVTATSDDNMSDSSLQQAMRLTQMHRSRAGGGRVPGEPLRVSKTRLKTKTRTYATLPAVPGSPQVLMEVDDF